MSTVEVTSPTRVQIVQVRMPDGIIQLFERPVQINVRTPGPQGPRGADGEQGENAIVGVWRGAWAAGSYEPLDLVQHGGNTWLHGGLVSTVVEPPIEPNDVIAPWELVAAKGSSFTYVHEQAIPDDEWTINHALGGFPNVTALDSTDREIVGDIEYVTQYVLKITFSSATAGKAYLS